MSERGQALVETALILPILLLLVIGGVYVARIISVANDATQLAGDGVRFAAVGKPSLKQFLMDRAKEQSNGFHDAIQAITIKCLDPAKPVGTGFTQVGNAVQVSVTVKLGSLPLGLGNALTATRRSTMRIEQPPPDADYENC